MLKKCLPIMLLFFAGPICHGQTVTGELKKWHKITIEFTDDSSFTETGTPNPFLDRRLNVTFTGPSGNTYIVPGYFAADGNAAETSANSGNKWHVNFAPDEIGTWTYIASFREGSNIAVEYPASASSGTAGIIDGQNGSFSISASDKTGRDLRGKGRLQYVGDRYLKFAETGEYFIKGGPDSPENFLAFQDFDEVYVYAAPDRIKSYANHVADWNTGDPLWQSSKGKGIIGAINYLSGKGMNSFSFLTMNKFSGDTKDVTMHVDVSGQPITDYTKFDVSRTAQWEIVFEHADKMGMHLHFKTQEQENANQLDGGTLGTDRKLYYRELIARFGHHLALNWNMGEENNPQAEANRIAQLQYVADLDPYDHLRVVHTTGSITDQDAVYNGLLGNLSELTGVSLQALDQQGHDRVKHWIDQSLAVGKKWPVSLDETQGGGTPNLITRQQLLYGTYFAGGHGVEYYFAGTDTPDFTLQDFRTGKEEIWNQMGYAMNFIKDNLPFTQMAGDDGLTSSSFDFCFAKVNDTYAIYTPDASNSNLLDLGNTGDNFSVQWYDPRNGGALQNGSATSVISNGTAVNLGTPPSNTTSDWVILVKNSAAAQPSITINNISIDEGDNAVFTVTLDNAVSGGFTVDYSTANSTAVAGSDYTSSSNTLTFAGTAGEQQTITITTIDDTTVESSEQFFVNLSNISNAGVSIDDNQGAATIQDNDTVTANISINNATVTEGENAVFTVSLDNAVAGGFTLDYTTTNDGADAGSDYTLVSGTLTFAGTAGETQQITVPTTDDSVLETDEGFLVNLSNLSSTNVNFAIFQGFGTIIDNDSPVNVSINDVTITEGGNAIFTLTLDAVVAGGFTIDYTTANDSAISGQDYTAGSGTLTFVGTAGETQTITITTIDDTTVESNEQFFVNLSNATGGTVTIADSQGTAIINDNDSPTNVSINDVTITEGSNAIFTLTLDAVVAGGFTIDYATADDSAISGQDYTTNSGTLTFLGTAGETQTITVATIDDTIVESNEQFLVNLGNVIGGPVTIADAQGTATINNNDSAISLNIDDASANEGETLSFPVTLSQTSGADIVFTCQFTNVTTDDLDYDTTPVQITILAGETTAVIEVPINTDAETEPNETFTVGISSIEQGVLANINESAIGTIVDVNPESIIDFKTTALYPVPITSNDTGLTIDSIPNGGFNLYVYTIKGELVFNEEINVAQNSYSFPVSIGFSSGIYFLRLDNNLTGDSFKRRFLVAR